MSDSLNEIPRRQEQRAAGLRAFRLAGRLIQPDLNRVVSGGETIQVEPKIMQVLLTLADRAGAVVTKEELIERVWEGVFVSDDVLVRAIGELRRILEDGGGAVIETIRKRGYRLIAPVVHDPPAGATLAQAPPPRRAAPWLAIAAIALAFGVAAIALVPRRGPSLASRFVPVTSLEGNEYDPVLSPDGTRIAFAWDGGRDGPTDVYVKMLGADTTLRLTAGVGSKRAPVWSPDGTRVAFLTLAPGACAIDVVSALGGPTQRLAACGNREHPRFAWSPDGRWLAISQKPRTDAPSSRLRRVPLEGGAPGDLTADATGDSADTSPAFSPDGRTIAFIRELSDSVGDLYLVPAAGGQATRLTFDNADIMGFTWIDAGRRLAFSSNRAGMYSLWALPSSGGEPELLAGGGRKMKHPSASRAGDAVAYEAWNYDMNLWRLPLGVDAAAGERLAPASDEWTFEARYSPDGRAVAFVSTRSGSYEIWLRRPDGSVVRLTSFGGPYVGEPRWSPDGKRIVFVARPGGRADVYAVDAAGGAPQRLTSDPMDELAPSVSADGEWLYFASRRSGDWRVHKRHLATGEERQVTEAGGYAALESPDGRWLYHTRIDRGGLWRRPVGGGAGEQVTAVLRPEDWASWGVGPLGVYWLVPPAGEGDSSVFLLRPGEAEASQIATLRDLAWPAVDVSPDGRELLYSRLDHRDSNIVLLSLGARP